MNRDEGLPQKPAQRSRGSMDPNAADLAPLESLDRDFAYPYGSKFSRFVSAIGQPSQWSPEMAIGVIFVGSFVAAVLLTSLILAGVIEIQPQAIKSFFKSLMGKN